ncbi:MAG: amino acid adenylation domain-containing protein [Pseudomonadota bacterium]
MTRQANKQVNIDLLYHSSTWNDLKLLERMEHISQQILSGENRLQNLSLLLDGEAPGIKPTAAPYQHHSMSQWLDQCAQIYADNIAITHLNHTHTHSQLHSLANQLAHHLIAQGMSKHDKVAVYLPAGFDFMVGLLSLVKASICYIPIDPNYPIERITYILDDANISCLITSEHLSNALDIESSQCIMLDESSSSFYIHAGNYPTTQPDVQTDLDDLFYTIYTSGSTGKPKATAVKVRGEINLLQWYCKEFSFSEHDNHLVISASGFDLTQKNFFAPLLSGGRLTFPDNNHHDVEHLQELIHTHQATVINCAPSAFYPLIEDSARTHTLMSLRLVLFGGESIRMNALIDWLEQDSTNAQIVNMYGPTECTDIACFYRVVDPHAFLERSVPIGKPNDNVRVYVVDDNLTLLPAGIPGELLIGGEGVGAGYINRSNANEQVFIDNPFSKGTLYRTGDLVTYDSDGELVFIGRMDKQLKLRGLRIEPGEIETQLAHLPGIDSALVTVHNEQLVAYVRPHANNALPPDWKQSLATQLPQYMVPSHAVTIDAWPLSPNGKIDTNALPEPQIETQYVPARTMTQSALIDLWKELLNVDDIGIQHDFFELGGHSLTAAKLASRIRDQFEVELQLNDLFTSATIDALARIIDQKQADGEFIIPSISLADRSHTLKLSHAQEQLWLVEQLHLGISAYNMPVALQLKGEIQLDSLEYALQTICQRHEVLRTQFLTDEDGQPFQFIQPSAPSPLIEYHEVDGLSHDEQMRHAHQVAQHEVDTPFDLTQAPLARIKLIKYTSDHSLLLMTMHHIVSDGWSLNIILHELFESYQAHQSQRPVQLPTLNIQYADYSMWQRAWLAQSAQPQIDYWLTQLKDAPHILRLPTDYPRPAEQTFNGMLHRFTLDASMRTQLETFSSKHNATLFMTLLLGYSILLSRFAQTRDVIIGSPNAGRTHVETEHLIGFFVNPMILRLNTENQRLSDLIQHTKDTVLNALANQQVPAELIIEQLKIPRHPSYPPIAQVGFALQNLGNAHSEILNRFESLEISQLNPNQCIAKYDLTLFFFEQNGELHGAFEYNSDLFTPETLDNLSDQLSNIYQAMSTLNNDQYIDQIELSTSEQLFKRLQLDDAEYESCHPLPATMQDFYLNALINPDTLSNNIGAGYFTDSEHFNLESYSQRLKDTVKHYSVLRGKLIPADNMSSDSAYLAIRHDADIALNYFDVSDQQMSDDDVITYARKECLTKYNLDDDELIRVYVLKLNQTRHYHFLAANHILIDGMSGILLMKHAANERTVAADDNFLSYVQYSRARYDQPETLQFWKQALSNHQIIHKHPSQESGLVQSSHVFDESLTKAIKKHCFNQRITPQILFKSVYGLLIAHYYRCEQDFIIRDTLNGRIPEFSNTIGCLAESPPFIFPQHKISSGDIESITKLYAEILALNELSKPHRAISLSKQASLTDTSGLQFVFNILQYMNHVNTDAIDSFHTFTPLEIENSVQLMITVDKTVTFELRYNKKDFQEKQFFKRFEQLCEQILANEQHILQYRFVLPDEETSIPKTVLSAMELSYPSLIHSFTRNASMYGDKTALSLGDERLSYRILNEHSNRLAHHLSARGVREHDLVCLYLDRSIEMIVSILAVMKLNATYVPLDPHSPAERVNYILKDSQAHAFVSTSSLLNGASINTPDILISLDQDVTAIQSQRVDNLAVPEIADDATCYIIYTSGTTGQPKGCLVSNINAARLLSTTQPVFQFTSQDVWTLYHSCAFDFSVWEIWGALYHAGELVIIPNDVARSPTAFYNELKHKRVTVLNQTPSAFTQLIDEDQAHASNELSLRYVIFGGEALNINALSRWVTKHPLHNTTLVNMYGITETTVHASYHIIDEDDLTQDASIIGYPLPDLHIQLVDQHKRPVAPGFLGEILVSGLGVSHGYLRRPELTAERFFTRDQLTCYASGDLAVHNHTGRLEYLGRIDQQVKIRGHRIELGEIESKLSKLNYIQEALVLAKDDQHGDKQLIAYTQCDHDVSSGQLRADLSEHLPDYMVPALFVSIDEWPQTDNGKVDLNALPNFDLDQDSYVAPRNKLEVQLAQIWQDIMGIEQIGVFDNFFDIGGHSLIAVRLAKRIQDELNIDLPVAALFNAQDIASLASALSKGMVKHECLVPLKVGQNAPIFLIHPINGLALGFSQLAQHMQTERPIIGIQAFGLTDDSVPSIRVEEAATRYIDAIKKAQAEGPYLIAGYSLGGVIALEVARQLIQQGDEIQWFTVIDAEANFKWFSRRIKPHKLLYDFFKLMHPESPLKYSEFERVPTKRQIDHLASYSNDTLSPEFLARALGVLKGFKSMMDNYQAKPLHIDTLYISAESRIKNSLMRTLKWTGLRKETLGWEKVITGQLTHISSPGDHESMMQEPYVKQLASVLDYSLKKSEP